MESERIDFRVSLQSPARIMQFSNEDLILSAYEAKIPAGKYRPALHSRISVEAQRELNLCIDRTETDGVMGNGGALWGFLDGL